MAAVERWPNIFVIFTDCSAPGVAVRDYVGVHKSGVRYLGSFGLDVTLLDYFEQVRPTETVSQGVMKDGIWRPRRGKDVLYCDLENENFPTYNGVFRPHPGEVSAAEFEAELVSAGLRPLISETVLTR